MRSPAVVRHAIHLRDGRTTTVSLENRFWQGLKEIARGCRMRVSELVEEVAAQPRQSNLSSALRLFVLEFYRSQIPDPPDGERV
jgi:predicted DNA-binding ribbon-helix-helix protein